MPDFQDRVIQGAGTRGNVGTQKAESLPDVGHYHLSGTASVNSNLSYGYSDAPSGNINSQAGTSTSYHAKTSTTYLSQFNNVYKTNAPVQQNALCMNIVIKY